jgi:benzoyl-CoA reductase/2-hydroxyglutaryl-CoA dehydratase subunit BcrC/BadD/HgdB
MNLFDQLQYAWMVNLFGPSMLRVNRWLTEYQSKRASRWDTEILAPPLKVSFQNKELVGRHWLRGRYANLCEKVVWVTSGAPVEVFKALGFYVLYPENHAAICGTARVAVEICSEAEHAGYSRDICSYARTDFGSVLSGKTPVGKLPKPDLLVTCTNICQTVLFWYRVLAKHFNVPLIIIDTPFVYSEEASDHAMAYVKEQLERAVPIAERVAGVSLSDRAFRETGRLSKMASELWLEIMERNAHQPAPISVFDQFIQMAPIVEMRGDPETVDFYAAMLEEVDQRIAQGVGAVRHEKKRLLWDNLPIWYGLRYLAESLGQHGFALVASTYTNAWGELAPLIDPEEGLDSMARAYTYPILNRGTGHKLKTMQNMIEKYDLDGVILHSDRSCKPYSIGQMDQRDRLIREFEVPALLLEADHSDSRAFSEEQVANRISAFVEMMGERA